MLIRDILLAILSLFGYVYHTHNLFRREINMSNMIITLLSLSVISKILYDYDFIMIL